MLTAKKHRTAAEWGNFKGGPWVEVRIQVLIRNSSQFQPLILPVTDYPKFRLSFLSFSKPTQVNSKRQVWCMTTTGSILLSLQLSCSQSSYFLLPGAYATFNSRLQDSADRKLNELKAYVVSKMKFVALNMLIGN